MKGKNDNFLIETTEINGEGTMINLKTTLHDTACAKAVVYAMF